MNAPANVPAVELRVSIADTEPLIWRQLVLPETATVADFHEAIQQSFGWKDCHLYGVRAVDRAGRSRVIIGTDDDVAELGGELASGVGLLELLDPQKPGPASMEYEYDFGDCWTHNVEVIGPATIAPATIACISGAMRGPIEDSGGVGGYANVVAVLGSARHPEHRDAAQWFEQVTGERASEFDPAAFDLVAANGRLRHLARRLWPGPISIQDIEAVLAPMLWFLREASPEGLELTSAGYLKPAFVRHVLESLDWDRDWFGARPNEGNVPPVFLLREQLQEWKLLRKYKGRLLLTPAGRSIVGDPAALWDYAVERVAAPGDDAEYVATRLLVHWQLAGIKPPYDLREQIIREALHSSGLRAQGLGEIPLHWARELDGVINRRLSRLVLREAEDDFFEETELTDGGLKFLLEVQRRMGDRS